MVEGESPGILETNLRPVDVTASGVIEEVDLHRSHPSESARWWPSLLVNSPPSVSLEPASGWARRLEGDRGSRVALRHFGTVGAALPPAP